MKLQLDVNKVIYSILSFLIIPFYCVFASVEIKAQSKVASLQAKYSMVQYHSEGGGWYFLSYQKDGQTLYGFADKDGNVVATDAYKYVLHKGYIELYLLDQQKKALHDQWRNDMVQYERDMVKYQQVNAKYEAEVEAYNIKRAQAREEAQRRYKREQELAQKRAEYENQRMAQQNQGTGTWGAVLGALSGALNTVNAATSVKFDPIFNQVLAERNLLVKPSEPYNPRPTKPTEPSSGFHWAKYPFRQNSNYTYVDYDKIKDGTGFANVKNGNKYGLVDAEFKVIVPCNKTREVLKQSFSNNHYLINVDGVYSVINENARKVIADAEDIKVMNGNYNVKRSGKWGVYNLSGKVISQCKYNDIKSAEGHYICKIDDKWGVFTPEFKQIYSCKYQDANLQTLKGKKILFTKLNGQWGAIDFSTAKDIVPNNYAEIKYNTNNSYMTVVKGNKKSGVYTTSGRMLIPAEYDNISIKDAGIEVKLGNTVGLYDYYGFCIIPAGKYTSYRESAMGSFKVYEVKQNNLIGLITPFGSEIVQCRYDELRFDESASVFFARAGDRAGILACDGSTVVPFVKNLSKYSAISNIKNGKPYILLEGVNEKYKYRYGAVDYSGKILVHMRKKNSASVEKDMQKVVKKNLCDANAASKAHEIIKSARDKFIQQYSSDKGKSETFTYFAQNYVENIVNDWQKRGEFEKTEDYQKRVNVSSRQAKVLSLTNEAKDAYIAMRHNAMGQDNVSIVGKYDADNETYMVKTKYSKEPIVVHVPSEHAQSFKSSFATCTGKPQFYIENDGLSLSGYTFVVDGRSYFYNSKNELTYQVPDVVYSFDAIQIDKSAANLVGGGKKQKFSTTQFITKNSDVDVNIPVTATEQKNTFAVIIANENYDNEQNVPFAYHDGSIFQEYCIKTLGIPKQNIRFGNDLTANQMRSHINWISETAHAFGEDAKFIVYYVGHGMPDDKTKDAYLLPSDGDAQDVKTGYRLADMYATLGELPASNVLVLLDACFSGAQRDGSMMQKGARGVALSANKARPKGNVIVMSASDAKQTAWPYAEKSHGLFTYFILKKLQESKGVPVSMGEMFKFVKSNVSQHSIVNQNKSQTPTLIPSASLLSTWSTIKI